MLGFNLVVGDSEASLLETAIVLFSLSNILQWCFFIMLILLKLHNKPANESQYFLIKNLYIFLSTTTKHSKKGALNY